MFNFNEADALASDGAVAGKKVLDSGVYNITINHAAKAVASTGTSGIDWNFTVEGGKYPNMVYGFWTNKANGDKIFNLDVLMGLMGILGLSSLTEQKQSIDIKDGTKEITAYKELNGVQCQVAVQKILDVYNGEVREKNEIKAFFNEEGKTYAEATRGSEAKQKTYYSEKMGDKETTEYKKFQAEAEPVEEVMASGSLL